ncbi:MAG TPA: PQQ-binding-like beta-propeller repeat protein [Acidimicrobiales bacterium]
MRVAVALATVLALSGCWPVPGQNADRTAHNPFETALTPATVGELRELWSADLGDGAVAGPIVAAGGVVATSGTRVHRVDAATGAPGWTWTPAPDYPLPPDVSRPFALAGRILVGYGIGNTGGIWQGDWLDPATGEVTGSAPHGGLFEGARGMQVVLYSYGFGSLTPIATSYQVLDLQTGASRGGWLAFTSEVERPRGLTLGTARVYHAGDGIIPPAEPGGSPTSGQAVRALPISGGSDACGPAGTRFTCPLWVAEVGGTPTAAVIAPGETAVYVGTSAGAITALDAATGARLWTVDAGAAVTEPPALAGGVLYAGTAAGDLVAVAADGCGRPTCQPLWTAAAGTAAISTQPAVAGSGADAVVYAATAAGDVVAVAAAGCGHTTCDTPLWSAAAGARITGGPVVTGGRVHVGTQDGRLVTYGRPAP